MDKKVTKPTEAQLLASEWRWRNHELFTYDPKTGRTMPKQNIPMGNGDTISGTGLWKTGAEWGCFNYELVRRLHREKELPNYFDLSLHEQSFINAAIGHAEVVPIACHKPELSPGWVWSDANEWRYNLNATNKELADDFLRWLNEQREKHNAPEPTSEPFTKSQPAKWYWLELMDLRHFKIRRLNQSEIETVDRARKKAHEMSKALIEKLKNPPARLKGMLPDNSRLFMLA